MIVDAVKIVDENATKPLRVPARNEAVPSLNVLATTRPALEMSPLEIEPLVTKLPCDNAAVPSYSVNART